MYYTIYKITNQINGKFYIGSHKTKDLNDNYMGSGKYLKHAQEKYGIENFTKEILFVFDTPEAMYIKEAEIVNEDFIATENTYNLKIGGFGGFDYINANDLNFGGPQSRKELTKRAIQKIELLYKNDTVWAENRKKQLQENMKKANTARRIKFPHSGFYKKHHTDETKQLIGEKNSIHQSGTGNSQYGTRWIHSLECRISKKIKKQDPLPDGWVEGRKLKFNINDSIVLKEFLEKN